MHSTWVGILLLSGCAEVAAVAQAPAPVIESKSTTFAKEKATLRFATELGAHVGIANLPRQTSRKFSFQLPKGTEELHISSCHREVSFWRPAENLVWNYIPATAFTAPEPVEYSGNCMLSFTAITNKGKTLRGLVAFSGDETATAKIFCNEQNGFDAAGFYLCQARESQIQALAFSQQMHATWKDGCAPLRSQDNRSFVLNLSAGLCVYAFQSFDRSQWFRLQTFGYSIVSLPDYE
jgi:hypothetical protein